MSARAGISNVVLFFFYFGLISMDLNSISKLYIFKQIHIKFIVDICMYKIPVHILYGIFMSMWLNFLDFENSISILFRFILWLKYCCCCCSLLNICCWLFYLLILLCVVFSVACCILFYCIISELFCYCCCWLLFTVLGADPFCSIVWYSIVLYCVWPCRVLLYCWQ